MSEAVTAPSGKQRTCPSCNEPATDEQRVCSKCGTVLAGPPVTAPEAAAGKPTDLGVGETLLNQWKLESKIGEGGMGNVFLATELKLGRKVAVKALSVENLQDETVKRFEREAQVMGKLDHPNIVTLYAVGRHRDVPFLVMRYLEGGSLWDLLDANGGRLTPEQLLPLVKQLCSALGYIHGKNLIHRDLKPSNIFISPQGKVTLLDLGLARGHTTALTRTGIIWGTPDFMAPEQIVGEKQLDGRADLYALGVVLYRMISNQPPFPDEDEQDLMRAHLTRPRPDISKVWFGATPALSLVLQKAMAIKPEDRYQTAEELAQAFERAAGNREQSTRAAPAVAAAPASKPVPVVSAAPAARPAPVGSAPTVGKPVAAPVPSAPRPSVPSMKAVPVAAVPAPVTTPARPSVVASPPVALNAKHPQYDDDDDDRTEAGELPPELLAMIHGDAAAAPAPAPPPPAKVPDPVPRKSQGQVPRVSAPAPGPMPSELSGAPSRRSGVTAFDRPALRDPPPEEDSGEATVVGSLPVLAGATPEGGDVTYVPRNAAGGVVTAHEESDTGPEQPVVEAALAQPMLGDAMVVATGDFEAMDDPKTEIGSLEDATKALTASEDQTRALVPSKGRTPAPGPRMSAPRMSAPRKSQQAIPAQRSAAAAEEADGEESPPWMHPYVLVTGGLLLLALGFLIGVLLR